MKKFFFAFAAPLLTFLCGCSTDNYRIQHMKSGTILNAINTDFLQYLNDNNERVPESITNTNAVIQALQTYRAPKFVSLHDNSIQILFNCNLRGKDVKKIKEPGRLITFFEAKPDKYGMRWVAFLGVPIGPTPYGDTDFTYVRLVDEASWRKFDRNSRVSIR